MRAPYLSSSRILPDVAPLVNEVKDHRVRSSKRNVRASVRSMEGASPDAWWRVAVGKRSKRQTTETCAGRRVLATGTSLYAFPTRFAVVTREVAKMLPVPTSSKELRTAASLPLPPPPPRPSVSSRTLSRYIAEGIGCYGTAIPRAEIMASVKPKVEKWLFLLSNRRSCRHIYSIYRLQKCILDYSGQTQIIWSNIYIYII